MEKREAEEIRKTKETEIRVRINLDGEGKSSLNTSFPFWNHMLTQFALHGLFDLEIEGRGDVEVDFHHLVEDLGICMGKAVKKALGERRGISRYGFSLVPMDEALVQVVVDISGRPYLSFTPPWREKEFELAEGFFRAFSTHAGITLHIHVLSGESVHHILEALFKAFGLSLSRAVQEEPRRKKKIPSSKGGLE